MQSNKASKSKAVNLIRNAVKSGWKREVSPMRLRNEKPFAVMVTLRRDVHFTNGFRADGAQIIVSFRLGRRSSVAITTYRNERHNRGLWDAAYALREVNATATRIATLN